MPDRVGTAIWSPEAVRDLDEIWNYYHLVAGGNTAEKIVRRIGEFVAMIEDHPFAGRSRNELRQGLRSLAAAPHVIFYRIKDDIPEIIRILDSRRDIDEIFAN
jgi:toxin ParE1/3/4